jgi:hypothetical protein
MGTLQPRDVQPACRPNSSSSTVAIGGRVITQALSWAPHARAAPADLAKGYAQINSSVGQFATDTLIADTKALASASASDDSTYEAEQKTLRQLADDRDRAAVKIKETLARAAAGAMPTTVRSRAASRT